MLDESEGHEVELLNEEGHEESNELDKEEDPVEVTEDEDEAEEGGLFDMLAKMFGGWW